MSFEDAEDRLQLGAQLLHGFGRERAPGFRFQLAGATVLLDFLPRAFDRVFLGIEQVLHEHDQLDLAPLIDAIAGAVFGRIEKPELTLPVAQHVRLQVGQLAHLTDREELLHGLDGRAGAHLSLPPLHCSAFSSRSIKSAMAWRGGLFWNSTLATSLAIGSSTPCCLPSATAGRAVLTPSTTARVAANAFATGRPCSRAPA